MKELIRYSSEQLHCCWRPPSQERDVDDLQQYLSDFSYPRARFTPSAEMLKLLPPDADAFDQVITILVRSRMSEPGLDASRDEEQALEI